MCGLSGASGSLPLKWINNQHPSVSHTLCWHTHTPTHTRSLQLSQILHLIAHPKHYKIFWKCRRRRRRICLEYPWFGEKVTVGFSGVGDPFHFLFFKCHEDWVVWVWQCVHTVCPPPLPPCPLGLCHLDVRAAPRQLPRTPCWNLITTALFNWNGIEGGGDDNRASFEAPLSVPSHSLSLFPLSLSPFTPARHRWYFLLSMSAPASFCSDE